ncbi:phage tail sheath family protein [Streptomyces sp. NPDC050658]
MEESDGGSRPIQGIGTAVAAFVGFAEQGPLNRPVRVANWSQFLATFGEFIEHSHLARSVYGYFANGGGACYIVRVDGQSADIDSAPRVLRTGSVQPLGSFQVSPLPGVVGQELTVEVQRVAGPSTDSGQRTEQSTDTVARPPRRAADKTEKAAPKESEGPSAAGGETDARTSGSDLFRLVIKASGKRVEAFEVSTDRASDLYVATQVRKHSQFISVVNRAAGSDALVLPEKQAVTLHPASGEDGRDTAADAETSAVSRYVGDVAKRSGFAGLEAVDEVTILAAPDLMAAYQRGMVDREQVKAVQLAMIDHCERMANRVAVIDPLPNMSPAEVHHWRQTETGFDSKYAALYYPWVGATDPVTGKQVLMPPSGHVAGVWARSDTERGVHKAPANEVVRGVLDLPLQVTKGEQELLNPVGINCIRSFPGRGIRVWGARTLSSDPAWRYLNVRRLFNYLEESIFLGTQWVVFEPNGERLWATIRRNIAAFLVNEWRQGALFGRTAEEAFYVKCDAETNPPEVIDTGQVVCEIGVAPVKPAEFVVFRLSQAALGGGESAE